MKRTRTIKPVLQSLEPSELQSQSSEKAEVSTPPELNPVVPLSEFDKAKLFFRLADKDIFAIKDLGDRIYILTVDARKFYVPKSRLS